MCENMTKLYLLYKIKKYIYKINVLCFLTHVMSYYIFCNNSIFVLVLSETKGDVILNLIKIIINNLIITIHLCISVK